MGTSSFETRNESARDWSRDTEKLISHVLRFEEAWTYDRDPQDSFASIRGAVLFEPTLGLWMLSYLSSREIPISRVAAADLALEYGQTHGLLPTGVLVTLLRDVDDTVSSQAWIALHRFYEDPGAVSAAAAEIDSLIEASRS